MKKRWFIWLSLLVLVVNLIPNIWQGYTVLADSMASKTSSLINQEDLVVTSNVTSSQEKNVWEIHYRFNTKQDNEKRRLKFQFLDAQNQTIPVMAETGWTVNEVNQLIGTYKVSDEGSIKVTTDKSVSKIWLNIQTDTQFDDKTFKEDTLSEDIGKRYELSVSENDQMTSTSASSVTSSTEERLGETTSVETSETRTNQNDSDAASTVGQAIMSQSALLGATPNYTNISPQYTTDNTGTYPTYSWQPTGNQTVINHQGKVYGANGWDGLSSWNGDPSNNTNSYIEYDGKGKDAAFAIRKYAKETNTPGLYDVYLNVRGNEQKDIKPIDIVLVVDMSGSMESANNPNGSDRASAVREGVKQFLASIKAAGIQQYVNVGLVGFSSPGYIGGQSGYIEVPMKSVSDSSHVTEINSELSQTFRGGTFTQIGIRRGANMLQMDASSNPKMMILLTDGVPTFSYKVSSANSIDGTIYGTSFGSNRDEPGNTSKLSSSYNAGGYRINDTWPATLGEAKIAKDSGIELKGLGIQLGADGSYLSQQQVRDRMNLLTSPGLYEDANTTQAVQDYLVSQAKNVVSAFNTVVNGSISDPIGSQFNYNGNQVDVTSVGSSAISNLPSATMTSNQLNISGLNIGKNQEIQLHYQVRLNTETSDFVPNKWYQLNGDTTLTPNGNASDIKVNFGVPSAKGEGVELTFKKIWEEYDGDKSLRPTSVTYQVSREATTISNAWQTGFINVEGTKDQNTWTKTTSQLASAQNGTPTLWLPKYNAQGVAFKYKVSNEVKVNGYDTVNVDATTFKNTKQFIPLKLEVVKADGLGKKLTGASFKLVDSKGAVVTSVLDASGTTFTFSNLKTGKYTLTEVKAPDGYVILKQAIQVEILSDGSAKVDNTAVKVDNHTIQLTVDNHQKGSLPATGGSGRTGFWLASLILLALLLLIAAYYWHRNHKADKKTDLKNKHHLVSFLGIMIVLGAAGIDGLRPTTVVADTTPVTFKLHKRVYRDASQLKTVQNNGLVINPNDPVAKDLIDENLTYGLNGVTFEVYDATQYVTDHLATMSQEALLKKVTDTDKNTLLSEIAPYHALIQDVVTQTVNGEDGVAAFNVNPKSDSSAYLIIETKLSPAAKDQVEMTATPMLVILPVENPTQPGTYLNTINLYPKNTAVKQVIPPKPTPPPTKSPLPDTGEAKSIVAVLGVLVVLTAIVIWFKKSKQ